MSKITREKKALRKAQEAQGVVVAKDPMLAMKKEDIYTAAQEIRPGCTITIRYNDSADPIDPIYLLGMEEAGLIVISDRQRAIIVAIRISREWGGRSNRTVTLLAGKEFNLLWFADRVLRRIDYIKVE